MVGPWIMEWTHMLAAAAQMICACRTKSIKECVPAWLVERLASIISRYGPYADAMDLARFEDVCSRQDNFAFLCLPFRDEGVLLTLFLGCRRLWALDKAFLGTSGTASDPNAPGGDLVQICIIEYINKVRRQMGVKHIPWGTKMPAGYVAGIMDAAADGMSMAIRLKSAGCTIHVPGDAGRKVGRAHLRRNFIVASN